MQYTNLGRTGLQVSRLCLGTMNFGPQTSEADSHAIMDRALETGVNFFDTANRYGRDISMGFTEEVIGRWLAQGGRRDQIVLATKVYGPMGEGVNDRGLSAYHIRKACEDSAAPVADRPYRPLPDAPCRPHHAVGRNLAGDGATRARRQGPLRRQQQLCRMAHRRRPGRGQSASLHGPRLGAEPL